MRRLQLRLKQWFWPGTNWYSRDKARLSSSFLTAGKEAELNTLDCGCGNAFFGVEAYRRGSRCVGITLHPWELKSCEEMRDFLKIPSSKMAFYCESLGVFAERREHHEAYDQVLLLDVLEHIRDDAGALRQLHGVMRENGFLHISVPNRNYQGNVGLMQARASREEEGWHVRNGYTFEQLEQLLKDNGFEPLDRLRFGNFGSTNVTWIQYRLFLRFRDQLTILTFPLLWLIARLFFWPHPHTIYILARKIS